MKIDEQILKKMAMAAGGIILFIIIISLITSCTSNKKYTFDELESKLITLTKNYYESNQNSLPKEGNITSISAQHFVTDKKIKNLTLNTGENCTGEITVKNNNGYYLYLPKLTCNNNIPIALTEHIIKNENIVTTGNGLYKYDDYYLFRGETLNNYISFANKIWQIIRINNDGTLRVIDTSKRNSATWDNRYNIDRNTNTGINDFVSNDINSRIKDTLTEIYNNEKEFTNDQKAFFVKHDLCTGKRSINETINNGQVECSQILKDQIFGLIQANEYLLASLDTNCIDTLNTSCMNYNYLGTFTTSTWTLTADSDSTHKVYKIHGSLSLTTASGTSGVKIVGHLDKDVLYSSGTGTINDPYIIK